MRRAAALIIIVVAGIVFVRWYSGYQRREAYIYHCNEEGAGGMITSREYCEELYARSIQNRQ